MQKAKFFCIFTRQPAVSKPVIYNPAQWFSKWDLRTPRGCKIIFGDPSTEKKSKNDEHFDIMSALKQ